MLGNPSSKMNLMGSHGIHLLDEAAADGREVSFTLLKDLPPKTVRQRGPTESTVRIHYFEAVENSGRLFGGKLGCRPRRSWD